jgi:ligand-binding sensor domain-containing protein
MKKLLLVLLLAVSGNLYSTNVRFYDSRQLTCNLITSICQDTEGYIWVGTDYELNRFNGIQFAHYYNASDDSTSLLHNSVRCLMLDRSGTLWVGCINGLQYYLPDEDGFQQIAFGDGIIPHITGIAQFRSGEIWVVTSGFGIYRVELKQQQTFRVENIPHITDYQFFNYVYEDSRGIQWFGISEVGLLQYNPATGKSKLFTRNDLSGSAVISGMTEDKQGQLLVSTSTAVNLYDSQTDSFWTIASDESWIPARQLISTTEGQVYLATYGKGLKHINNHTDRVYSVSAFDTKALNNPYINIQKANIATIYEDRNRNLWLGCYQKGLLMLPNEVSPFKKWSVPAGQYPEAGVVQSIFLDRDEYLWSSIENEGVFKMDKQGNIVGHLNIGSHNFFAVEQDNAGDLWFGGKYSGLFQVNTKTGKITEHLGSEWQKTDIKSIKEDASGNLYISIFGKGFICYNPTTHEIKKFVNTINKNSVSNDWIYKFIIDPHGLVWLGHFNGVDCYNPETGQFTLYSLPGINKYVTYSLLEDSEGNIWAGTNQGLACFHRQTNKAEIFQEKDGLSNNVVYALVKDTHGNI